MADETTTTKWDVNHEPTNEDHESQRECLTKVTTQQYKYSLLASLWSCDLRCRFFGCNTPRCRAAARISLFARRLAYGYPPHPSRVQLNTPGTTLVASA